MKNFITIVIPTWNEQDNIQPLLERIDIALSNLYTYEVIFVDDHSNDKTQEIITGLSSQYPVRFYTKKGKKGKSQSLIEGFSYAHYDLICMIDADLQYPPEAIPEMIKKIENGADVVVANRKEKQISFKRKIIGNIYRTFFAKYMHGLKYDVQSGLKVFKRETVERISLHSSPWAFDLGFLIYARDGGYTIHSYDIVFSQRHSGKAKIGLIKASIQIALAALKLKFSGPQVIPFSPGLVEEKGDGFHHKGREFIHHSKLHHSQTAFYRVSTKQIVILLILGLIVLTGFVLNWHTTIIVFISVLTALYFIDLLFNFFLIYRSFATSPEIKVSQEEITAFSEMEWPSYTILCPLYKEAQVIPQFVNAIEHLDYPKEKLQVLLLLEEDDTETIASLTSLHLPEYFQPVIIPPSNPKTKPKACNYGLKFATGEYVVIFDAEDVPQPLQLKKAIIAFQKSDRKTVCIQAKLNFYNPHQNILTRVFTAEYSLWFDLVLTGLQSISAPIPLGGTSNHFRREDLHSLKGWDAFNVTEDCDLGIRLIKKGYKTAIVDAETLEEANSNLKNWFWQRTRWIKGYMQSYLVHMRNPKEFITSWKEVHVITFQMIVGGKVMSMLINPIMWIITICYFVFRAHIGTFIESFFPTPILYMGVFSMIIGNFLYFYYYMIGCAKREHFDIIKYVFLVPLYWLAMSIAAWTALYLLIKQPHHWSKTKHGLHLKNTVTAPISHPAMASVIHVDEVIQKNI